MQIASVIDEFIVSIMISNFYVICCSYLRGFTVDINDIGMHFRVNVRLLIACCKRSKIE